MLSQTHRFEILLSYIDFLHLVSFRVILILVYVKVRNNIDFPFVERNLQIITAETIFNGSKA